MERPGNTTILSVKETPIVPIESGSNGVARLPKVFRGRGRILKLRQTRPIHVIEWRRDHPIPNRVGLQAHIFGGDKPRGNYALF